MNEKAPMNEKVPEELKQWVREKQKYLDDLLVNDPENYLKARQELTEEYEAKLKETEMT